MGSLYVNYFISSYLFYKGIKGGKVKTEKLYSSAEVAEMIGIKQQSVGLYYRVHGIGTKDRFNNLLFTEKDIELIKKTDGRRK